MPLACHRKAIHAMPIRRHVSCLLCLPVAPCVCLPCLLDAWEGVPGYVQLPGKGMAHSSTHNSQIYYLPINCNLEPELFALIA